jgi:PAS domain-containing protein
MTSRTISNELLEYLNALLQFNPVFFSVIFVAVVILVIHVINQRVIIPSKIKYMEDKKKLENENLRLMALFAELDPDPVLRVNSDGVIIHYNKSAENILGSVILRTTHVSEVIPGIKNVSEAIKNDLSLTFFLNLNDRDYSTLLRGIPGLGFAQIYFHDITERKNYERKLKQFSRDLQDSLEEERKRIAFE